MLLPFCSLQSICFTSFATSRQLQLVAGLSCLVTILLQVASAFCFALFLVNCLASCWRNIHLNRLQLFTFVRRASWQILCFRFGAFTLLVSRLVQVHSVLLAGNILTIWHRLKFLLVLEDFVGIVFVGGRLSLLAFVALLAVQVVVPMMMVFQVMLVRLRLVGAGRRLV